MNGNARELGDDPGMAWRDLIPATDCRMATLKSLPHTKRSPSQPNDLFRFHKKYVGTPNNFFQSICWEFHHSKIRDVTFSSHE